MADRGVNGVFAGVGYKKEFAGGLDGHDREFDLREEFFGAIGERKAGDAAVRVGDIEVVVRRTVGEGVGFVLQGERAKFGAGGRGPAEDNAAFLVREEESLFAIEEKLQRIKN